MGWLGEFRYLRMVLDKVGRFGRERDDGFGVLVFVDLCFREICNRTILFYTLPFPSPFLSRLITAPFLYFGPR